MNKQEFLGTSSMATAVLPLAAFAVLIFIYSQLDTLSAISSHEVDDFLYKRLDAYEQAVINAPDLALTVAIARTHPERLSNMQRADYLNYERRFFSGWEAAWQYYASGNLKEDRFRIWNDWYVDETNRRPYFGWAENRHHFAASFARHVDDSIQVPMKKPALVD